MKEIDMQQTFEHINCMKKHMFKKHFMKKVQNTAFQYLLGQIKSKWKGFEYHEELKCQGHLLPITILPLEKQREIFSYWSRMNKLNYNFKGNNIEEKCKCGLQQ